MASNKSWAARSKPPPVLFPDPILPYNHPYVFPPPLSWSFVGPQQPIPHWDDHIYIYTQTLSSFLPPPPPPPFWDMNTCIYTQTLHPPYCCPHPPPSPPLPSPLPYCINYTTPTLHPPSNSPSQEEDLSHKILKQIEYYFCDNNLATDDYLKGQMDIDNGWVPIELIAGFNRIKKMTDDIKLILESLKDSDTVEVEGNKLRRRTTWKKWIAYRKAASRN